MPEVAEAYEGADRAVQATEVAGGDGPVIDGRLDEAAWRTVEAVSGFVERTPNLRADPTDGTRFRVLYDADALYVGVECDDSQPDRIKATTRTRDAFTIFADDAVTVKLDPAHDHRTTYGFALNPAGAQLDYIAANEGSFQREWDAVWDGAGTLTDSGWTAEWRIPWKVLGIDPSSPPSEIGINLSRDHARRNATYDWSLMPPPLTPVSSSRYGHIAGLAAVDSADAALEIKPYGLLASWDPTDPDAWLPQLGLDAAGRLGWGWRGQLSLFTDFAQVDVDDQVVNLSRFSVFFPEKRDFFIRDSDLFVFGWTGEAQLFNSRSVGIAAGEEIPILVGAKVVGAPADGVRVGLLTAVTDSHGEVGRIDNTVGRVQVQADDGSNVGLMITRKPDNHVFGIDGAWRGSGTPLLLEATAMAGDGGDDGDIGAPDTGGTVALSWRGELIRPGAWYAYFGEDFAPPLGFYTRTGVHWAGASLEVAPRIGRAGFKQLTVGGESSNIEEIEDPEVTDQRHSSYATLDWDSGYSMSFKVHTRREVVPSEFILGSATKIRPGAYTSDQVRFSARTPGTLPVGFSGHLLQGGLYGGSLLETGPKMWLRPSPGLRLEVGAVIARAHFEDDDPDKPDFTEAVLNGRIGTALSTKLALDAFVRWNRLAATASTVTRLRWTWTRGGDLFVVWQSDLDSDTGESQLQSVQTKIAWTWSP